VLRNAFSHHDDDDGFTERLARAISTHANDFAKRGRRERGGRVANNFVVAAPPLTNAGNGEQLSR
jgi:hypothetical protein